MRRPALFVAPLAALVLAVLSSSAETSSAQSTNIDVGNFYFCAASFESSVCDTTVTAGSTVTWQVSAGSHTVTQCDASFTTCPPSGGFDSGLLNSGGTYSQTFSTPGTISYWCAFHPDQMRGRLVVQAQPTATPTPTPTAGPGSPTPSPPPVPTTGSAGIPGATSGPVQVPNSGGSTGGSFPWVAVAMGMTLLTLGGAAGAGALATARIRAGGREN